MRRLTLILISMYSIVSAQNAWINELHYDNTGTDEGEFVEVVIENASSYNLADFSVSLYNGYDSKVYSTKTLDAFTVGSTEGTFSFFFFNFPADGIQNGSPDGLALSYQGTLISGQFLSYEGEITGADGPANGVVSTDIGVEEPGEIGESLQLTGTGANYSAFTWVGPAAASVGGINAGQVFSSEIFAEPSNHVTDFAVDSVNSYAAYLSWTGAVGDQIPSRYLVLGKTASGTYAAVLDNNPVPDDLDWSDGNCAVNIVHQDGKNILVITGLSETTDYDFVIYPYTNSGTDIDFKTDGTIPTVSATTTEKVVMAIKTIQETADGNEGDSPYKGNVVSIAGVVTGIITASTPGYFIQDASEPWSGIFIADGTNYSSVALGDQVELSGTVGEHYGLTQIDGLTAFQIISSGNDLPTILQVSTGTFPQEKYESVLVQVKEADCTNADLGYGEWEINDGSGACRVDDAMYSGFVPELAQKYTITGLGFYSFSDFKIEPRNESDVQLITNAPVITQKGISPLVPFSNEDFIDTVQVVAKTSLITVELRYVIDGGSEQQITMSIAGNDSTYSATIPSSAYNDGNRVKYWVFAEDTNGETSEQETSGFFAGITPISSLKQLGADQVLEYEDYYARTTGVATVSSGVFSTTSLSVYIQDDAYGAIAVHKSGAGSATITAGHSYTIVGQLIQYNGLAQIEPMDVNTDIIDNGSATMPDAFEINMETLLSSAESFEGLLVKLSAVDTVAGSDAWPESGKDANVTITDDAGAHQLTLRVDKDTDIDENAVPAWPQNITGLFSQYDYESPFNSGYQLIPRAMADFEDATTIGDPGAQLPVELKLYQAYPNPFNPSTTIRFDVPATLAQESNFELAIFNSLGQKVRVLAYKVLPGRNEVFWNGLNTFGQPVSTGLYYAVLNVANQRQSIKLLLLK